MIENLQFKDGLIAAIVRDHATGATLMLAWMNEEAFRKTDRERERRGSGAGAAPSCGTKARHPGIGSASSTSRSIATVTRFSSTSSRRVRRATPANTHASAMNRTTGSTFAA